MREAGSSKEGAEGGHYKSLLDFYLAIKITCVVKLSAMAFCPLREGVEEMTTKGYGSLR